MATFQYQLDNMKDPKQAYAFRQKLIKEIEGITGRPLIVYAADFKKGNLPTPNSIDYSDKTGFSDLVEGIEEKPLDVFIQSPGGSVEATETIVNLLREVSPSIRFIIPHAAKSAATLMALSGDCILMDHRSELGPIDPQVIMPLENGGARFVPAQTIIDGFNKARDRIETGGPKSIPAYVPLISKYDLHLLEICQNARDLAVKLAEEWLFTYMFKGDQSKKDMSASIAGYLADHNKFLSHSRPIKIKQAKELGIVIEDLRKNNELNKRIWALYCAIELLFDKGPFVKIFENSRGVNWSRQSQQQQVVFNLPLPPGAIPPGGPPGPVPVPSPKK